jgi:hypothetical protein
MKCYELIRLLANLPPDCDIKVAVDGQFERVSGVAALKDGSMGIVRLENRGPPGRVTIQEEGLIGHMIKLGLSNDEMADFLQRPVIAIERFRKRFNL